MFSCTNPRVSIEVNRHSPTSPWTYSRLDQRQRQIAKRIREEGTPGTLLLSELAPVVTLGRRTPESDLLASPLAFSQQGIEVYPTDRGGFATYHGPGQWVLFPVERIEVLSGDSRGMKKTVESLLEVALQVGKVYDSSSHIRTGCEMGVWTSQGKFAAVGVHAEQGILLHGLSVNGMRTPTSFWGLRPCGLELPVDFILPEPSEAAFLDLGNRLAQVALRCLWKAYDFFQEPLTLSSGDAIRGLSSTSHVGA